MKPHDLQVCADCDEVYPTGYLACPSCTSHSAMPLSRLIEPVDYFDEVMAEIEVVQQRRVAEAGRWASS